MEGIDTGIIHNIISGDFLTMLTTFFDPIALIRIFLIFKLPQNLYVLHTQDVRDTKYLFVKLKLPFFTAVLR